jgi:DnaK suppressor protein
MNNVKAELQRRLTELEGRAGRINADLAEPLSADFAEQATELQDDVPLEQQEALIERKMASIKAALGRINDSSYGICTRCGEQISFKRLNAMPEAALCISCAHEAERH